VRADPASAERLHGEPGAARPSKGLTVTFVAVDAPGVAGVDLRARAWAERRRELERLLGGGDSMLRVTLVMDSYQAGQADTCTTRAAELSYAN
jgi:hypothetical protein